MQAQGRASSSGLQAAYGRIVEVLADDYRLLNLPDPKRRAEDKARDALSARQRARLDERRAA